MNNVLLLCIYLCIYPVWFSQSSVDGRLCPLLATVNNAAVHTGEQVTLLMPLGIYLGVELQGHTLLFSFGRNHQSSIVAAPFYV